jgi:hypothetical protein
MMVASTEGGKFLSFKGVTKPSESSHFNHKFILHHHLDDIHDAYYQAINIKIQEAYISAIPISQNFYSQTSFPSLIPPNSNITTPCCRGIAHFTIIAIIPTLSQATQQTPTISSFLPSSQPTKHIYTGGV